MGSQAPALDGGELVADEVHHPDRRAGCQQGPVDRLLVIEGQPGRRSRQEGRAATRDQRHDQVVGTQPRNGFKNAAGGKKAGFVGDGVRGLHDLDAIACLRIAIAGDDEPGKRAIPGLLKGAGHLRRCFAGSHHDRPPEGTRRQVEPNGQCRLSLGHGVTEHLVKQVAIHLTFLSACDSALARIASIEASGCQTTDTHYR
jgi:hypothetical protein